MSSNVLNYPTAFVEPAPAEVPQPHEVAKGAADAYVLAAGAAALGTVGHAAQEIVREHKAVAESGGVVMETDSSSLLVNALELVGNMPMDAKSMALGVAVIASMKMASMANKLRQGAEAPQQSRAMRWLKKAGALALAGGVAYADHKLGASPIATIAAGVGVMSAGSAYLALAKRA